MKVSTQGLHLLLALIIFGTERSASLPKPSTQTQSLGTHPPLHDKSGLPSYLVPLNENGGVLRGTDGFN